MMARGDNLFVKDTQKKKKKINRKRSTVLEAMNRVKKTKKKKKPRGCGNVCE
jgi:hypothetical protein